MTTLDDFAELARREQNLAVISTLRSDQTIQASVVNAGVMNHPVSGQRSVAFVTYGPVKLVNLRARPQIAVTVRSQWQWATVEGTCELIGPDDRHDLFDPNGLRLLLRDIFVQAGGTHDDWDGYDRVMLQQRRTAVFVTPQRIYSNRP
jgi:PPOX class probable F420-dependent enzyme